MNWQTLRKRVSALVLAAILAVTLPVSAAEAIGDGVTPTYDEAYYATLDYYGNLLEGSMVKSYALNGKDSLTDYGVYDEVANLTDSTVPTTGEGGTTTFRFGDAIPDHFYFEGKTKQPFEDLPWSFTLRYTLNGVPTKAEDLAGKQGVVEILLDIVPNEQASDYARYNYTLAATALFNQDDILSLEAPGAQVQLVGNLRTVLFLCLPGEEQHFTIRVGSNDFSFGGLTVLMMPATLAQLEEIAKLSERKDDLEEDYRALSGSLDDLLDALVDIQNGLYASASGLDQLNKARGTFSNGKGALYDGTDRLRGDLSNLADILEPVEQRIQLLSLTVTDSKAVLNEMTDATLDLQVQLADMEAALYGLEQGTYDLKHVIDVAADMESSLLRLEHALGGSHINTSSVSTNSKALVDKVKNVHGAYAAEDTTEFLEKMLVAQGEGSATAKVKAAGMAQLLAAEAAGLPVPEDQKANLETAKQLDALHQASQNGLPFKDFCEKLPGVSADQAKQMNDLWLIYNSGGSTSGRIRSAAEVQGTDVTVQAPEEPTPSETAAGTEEDPQVPAEEPAEEELAQEEEQAAEAPEEPPTESTQPETGSQPENKAQEGTEMSLGKGQMSARLIVYSEDGGDGDDGNESDDSAGGDGGGEDEGPTEPVPPSDPTPPAGSDPSDPTPPSDPSDSTDPGPSGDQTVGGAVVDLITSGLDSATARIDAIQSQVTNTLNQIKRPTSVVVGNLADLCGELDILIRDLDDAEDLMAALRQSSWVLRDILTDVDALRILLNNYEPTLQEALANAGTLSTSAVTTIHDTETLLTDAENLARSTGVDLDAGTKQSLTGLSAALRQTAKALALTKDVKNAKKTVTDIIEDTWNEYTGDVNNILLMDATAKPVSLTDSRNPAPTSIQVLIRTQEIKVEEPEENEESTAAKAKTTFWGRVAQMFKDFWGAITGIFH